MIFAALTLAAISGAIYAPDGKPVANARVAVQRVEHTEEQNARLLAGKLERTGATSTTTAANGTFSVDPKGSGVFELVIIAEGFAPWREYVRGDEPSRGIALERTATRRGRVVSGGKPVVNAVVVLLRQPADRAVYAARTDEKGAFSLPDPRQAAGGIVVLHPDYAPLHKMSESLPLRGSIELALDRGMRIAGKVVAPNGAAVANARIVVDGWPLAASGDDGAFVLPHVDAGAKSIEAVVPGMHGRIAAARDVVLNLAPSRTITGNVRDANREPLAGAVVVAWAADLERFSFAIADEKGSYRFDRCDAAQYQINVYATSDITFATPTRVNLNKQMSGHADFTASAVPYVRGVVVDARKRPVGGARISWTDGNEPAMYAALPQANEAISGPDGRFRIQHGTTSASLTALHPGHARASSEQIDLESGPPRTPITITLPDGIQVQGIVTDEAQKPIAGAAVLAIEGPSSAMSFPLDAYIAAGFAEALIETGEDGRFSIHLNRAPHDLVVWKEGYAAFRRTEFSPDRNPLDVTLMRGVAIRGRVTRKSGAPPRQGNLSAFSEDGTARYTELGPDATFEITSLAPGEYTIAFESRGGESAPRKVRAPADDVVIEIASLSEIRGRVLDKTTSEPIRRYRVNLDSEVINAPVAAFENGEPFTVEAAVGVARLVVTAEGYLSETIEVNVEEGKASEVTVAMNRGRTIRGRVTAESGNPIAEASLEAETEEGDRIGSAQTDDDGEYELKDVTRNALALNVTRSGFVSRRVTAGERDARVDVILSPGRRVSGRVITSQGAPVAGAAVYATSAAHGAGNQDATAAEDGAFTMQGLGDGRYSFMAMAKGYETGKVADADVSAGPIIITLTDKSTSSGTIHGTVEGFTQSQMMYGMVVATAATGGAAQAMIGRDGSYRIEDAPSGEVSVQATGGGVRGMMQSSEEHITLAAGGDAVVDLKFYTDITIRGVVRENGTPAPNRQVAFSAKKGNANAMANTDAAGAYEIVGLVPGEYMVSVQSRRGTYATTYEVTDSATFDIVVEDARIEGRVVDDDGAPIASAAIRVQDHRTTSDASGAFSLLLPAGNYSVAVAKSGFVDATVDAEAGTPLTVKLTRGDDVRVRIIDARDGTTLGGYVVALTGTNVVAATARETRADGTMKLSLPAGAYRIAASADGYASQSIRANVPAATELRVALTPGGSLHIHTTKASAQIAKLVLPNGEEYVSCHCNGISEIRLERGSAFVEHVAPAPYTLQLLDANGKVVATAPVTIVEALGSRVEL